MIGLIFGLNLGFSQGGPVAVLEVSDERHDEREDAERATTSQGSLTVVEAVSVTELVDDDGTVVGEVVETIEVVDAVDADGREVEVVVDVVDVLDAGATSSTRSSRSWSSRTPTTS